MTTQLLLTDLIIATLAYMGILMGADLVTKTIALWCECQKRAYCALQEPPSRSEAMKPEVVAEPPIANPIEESKPIETADDVAIANANPIEESEPIVEEEQISLPSAIVESKPVLVEEVEVAGKEEKSFAQMTIRELKAIALDWNKGNPQQTIKGIRRLKKRELVAALEGCS